MREGRNRQVENHVRRHDRERRRREHVEKQIKRDLRKLGWRVRDDQGDHDGQ